MLMAAPCPWETSQSHLGKRCLFPSLTLRQAKSIEKRFITGADVSSQTSERDWAQRPLLQGYTKDAICSKNSLVVLPPFPFTASHVSVNQEYF